MKPISIIVPCFNEAATITLLLDAIRGQTVPSSDYEIIIADGMSTDDTRNRIAEFARSHEKLAIKVIDNPARSIPAGLNRAIDAAKGEIIIRLDAHSVPASDYIEKCVHHLEKGLGVNVGGRWDIKQGKPGWMARSIAVAAANPIGVGDAQYRHGSKAGAVDTVPFGAYYRKTLMDLGGYNESLKTNEDYELNTRLRRLGGTIWFDPEIRAVYYARSTVKSLASQYFRYGFWKRQMLSKFPQSIRARQLLPPLFIASLFIGAILSIFVPWFWLIYVAGIALYVVILVLAGLIEAVRNRDVTLLVGVALAIGTMHFSWGGGFLASLFKNDGNR